MEGSHCERNQPPCVDGMAEGRFCLPSVIKDEKNEKKRVRAALHQSPWWACSNLTEADFPSSDRIGRVRVEERRPGCALLNDAYLWPSIVFRAMQRIHIPVERLSAFADSDNSILTTQEFGHLKVFTACFSTWIEFIRQVVRVSLFDRSQIITWHSGRGVSSSNVSSLGFDELLQ
jgi:hypothetical protein